LYDIYVRIDIYKIKETFISLRITFDEKDHRMLEDHFDGDND